MGHWPTLPLATSDRAAHQKIRPHGSADALQTRNQHSPVGAGTRHAVDATKKNERPRQTTTRRKPARADARALTDAAAGIHRIVGPFIAMARTTARFSNTAASPTRAAFLIMVTGGPTIRGRRAVASIAARASARAGFLRVVVSRGRSFFWVASSGVASARRRGLCWFLVCSGSAEPSDWLFSIAGGQRNCRGSLCQFCTAVDCCKALDASAESAC